MNLGEKLKALNARTEAEANRQRIERDAVASLAKRQELEKVQLFFSQAREIIVSDIDLGEKPRVIYLGKRGEPLAEIGHVLAGYGESSLCTSPKHPYHFAWQEFVAWATENGLIAKIHEEHDGGGMYSWHALTVRPT